MQRPVSPLAETAITHREAFREYVLNEAEPWHRRHLGRLYGLWDEWNAGYFAGAMTPPYILLSEPSEPKRYGDCGPLSGFGGRSQIRIRPSLLVGTHPHVQVDDEYEEGRFLLASGLAAHFATSDVDTAPLPTVPAREDALR